jgi:ABC-2 type transport system ATP-binding protein
MEATDLQFAANKKLKTFSGGMKRRAGIAQCLINDPKIIIVDEPTAGLDPEQRIRLKNLLANLSKDKIVLFSTHIISDLENICSEIGILSKGKLLFDGNMESLLDRVKESVWIGTCKLEGIGSIGENYLVVKKSIVKDRWEYRIVGQEPPFPDAQRDQMNMEDAYMAFIPNQEGVQNNKGTINEYLYR